MKLCMLDIRVLPPSPADCASLAASLPFGLAEGKRIAAFGNAAAARQSLGALLALQQLVQDRAHEDLTIIRAPGQKPVFATRPELSFNLSHSGSLCVAALSEEGEGSIGVDVELCSPKRDLHKLSKRFFTEQEQYLWQQNRFGTDCFFALWTKKEARAKMSGKGLAAILSQHKESPSHVRSWSLCAPQYRAMLSVCTQCPMAAQHITSLSSELQWKPYGF